MKMAPIKLAEIVGHTNLVKRLEIAILAARKRKHALPHILLDGPPGLGKTTLARVMANEMGASSFMLSGPNIANIENLMAPVYRLSFCDVLFIDEIHTIPQLAAESLLTVMENSRSDELFDDFAASVYLPAFTLVGATTELGKLPGPFIDRFGIHATLDFYTIAQLTNIIYNYDKQQGDGNITYAAAGTIARRSLGTPRTAIKLHNMCQDYCLAHDLAEMNVKHVDAAMAISGIDTNGLTTAHRRYINALTDKPQGIGTLSAKTGLSTSTIELTIEPYLLRQGRVVRTPRGRVLPSI